MSSLTDHTIESVPEVAVSSETAPVNDSDMARTRMAGEAGGDLVGELAALAAEQARSGGMQLKRRLLVRDRRGFDDLRESGVPLLPGLRRSRLMSGFVIT